MYKKCLLVCGKCKGVWRGVTAVSTSRDDLTFIVSEFKKI